MFVFSVFTVHSRGLATSKDMLKRGQWGGWQQKNRQRGKEGWERGWSKRRKWNSKVPTARGRLLLFSCCAAVFSWMRAGRSPVCVWPWMEAIFYPDSHRVINPMLLSCSPLIPWAEPPPRLISAKDSILIRFCFFKFRFSLSGSQKITSTTVTATALAMLTWM